MLDLRVLHKIVILAEEANFSRAATRLGLSQPALSRAVAQLEASCGLHLFDRSRTGVTPTAAGSGLIANARKLLGEVSDVEQGLLLQSRGEAGKISLGVGPLAGSVLLTRLLAHCARTWPLLSIVATLGPTSRLVEHVINADLDFCLCSANTLDPNPALSIIDIARCRLGYFVRKGHPLLRVGKPVAWQEIAPFPRVAGQSFDPLGRGPAHLFGPWGATLECDDYETLRKVTLASDAVWLTSDEPINADLEDGTMCEIRIEGAPPAAQAEIVLVKLHGRSLSPAVNNVIEAVKALAPS